MRILAFCVAIMAPTAIGIIAADLLKRRYPATTRAAPSPVLLVPAPYSLIFKTGDR